MYIKICSRGKHIKRIWFHFHSCNLWTTWGIFNGLYQTSPSCCMWPGSGLSSTRRSITQSFLFFILLGVQDMGIKTTVAVHISSAEMPKNENVLGERRRRHTFSVIQFTLYVCISPLFELHFSIILSLLKNFLGQILIFFFLLKVSGIYSLGNLFEIQQS